LAEKLSFNSVSIDTVNLLPYKVKKLHLEGDFNETETNLLSINN